MHLHLFSALEICILNAAIIVEFPDSFFLVSQGTYCGDEASISISQ